MPPLTSNRPAELEASSSVPASVSPSQAKVTDAYGGKGITVTEEGNLRPGLEEALEYEGGPSVVECFVAEEENVFPMVPAGAANENFILGENDA